jgi:hypothetical protein
MSKRIILSLFVASLLPLAARPAAAVSLQPFGSVDYYLHDGIEDDINKANNDAVNSVPAGQANGEVTTTNGVGGRLGLRVPFAQRRVDIGASYSYIKGPSIDSKLETPLGTQNNNTDTFFSRIMGEVGVNFPITPAVKFRLSGAAGMGHARVENHVDGSGAFAGTNQDATKESSGFTWEVSPAFVFGGPLVNVELGLRYAQFSPVDKTNDTPRIEWKPLGVYVGVAFF